MADASASPPAIAVGSGRHSERDHVPISSRRQRMSSGAAAHGVDLLGRNVPPPVVLLIYGTLLGFVHAAPGAPATRAGAGLAARTAVLEEDPHHIPAGDPQQPSRHPLDEHRTANRHRGGGLPRWRAVPGCVGVAEFEGPLGGRTAG